LEQATLDSRLGELVHGPQFLAHRSSSFYVHVIQAWSKVTPENPHHNKPVETTSDYSTAISWADEIYGPVNTPRFYIPPKRFAKAVRDGANFSYILQPDSSGGMKYGQAFGTNPPIAGDWDKCALDAPDAEICEKFIENKMVAKNQWDFYAAQTQDFGTTFEELKDDQFIADFLATNTESTSVTPGDPEILFWAAVGKDALAAVIQWESGEYIIASVATKVSERGKGLATELIKRILTELHSRGISRVGLGVAHKNVAAIKVYERCGFKLLSNFTNYFSESWLERNQ